MTDKHELPSMQGPVCPLPLSHQGTIVMGHGSGGKMSHDLIDRLFLPPFENPVLRAGNDAGLVQPNACTRLAISTDSHVVTPLFFPGGDIGRLAVCGTVNDLAMAGAEPLGLSVAMVLEEGLEISTLRTIVEAMVAAAAVAGCRVVTGDTKVVSRGQADGVYINTSGVGLLRPGVELSSDRVAAGDKIIVSGPIGDHGVAVMSRRAGLSFEADIASDSAPLVSLVRDMLDCTTELHAMRDPTRGGLAAALNELAEDSGVTIELEEESIPLRPVVRAACDTLGFDPLHVPCEGRLVAAVPAERAGAVLAVMRANPLGVGAAIIGEARTCTRAEVRLRTSIGGVRLVDLPAGELLPRIC